MEAMERPQCAVEAKNIQYNGGEATKVPGACVVTYVGYLFSFGIPRKERIDSETFGDVHY